MFNFFTVYMNTQNSATEDTFSALGVSHVMRSINLMYDTYLLTFIDMRHCLAR